MGSQRPHFHRCGMSVPMSSSCDDWMLSSLRQEQVVMFIAFLSLPFLCVYELFSPLADLAFFRDVNLGTVLKDMLIYFIIL